jgi:hypothetical protein
MNLSTYALIGIGRDLSLKAKQTILNNKNFNSFETICKFDYLKLKTKEQKRI